MNDRPPDHGDAFVAAPSLVRGGVQRELDASIAEAWDAHHRDLHTFARSLVREPAAAEDLVADAFAKLIAETTAGRAPDRARPWLFRVIANQVVNESRRRAVAARLLDRLVRRDTADPADAGLLRAEADAVVREGLLALPADARTALLLAAHGFSGREIASAIGRSEAATRTLLSRGRVRLREVLEGMEADR